MCNRCFKYLYKLQKKSKKTLEFPSFLTFKVIFIYRQINLHLCSVTYYIFSILNEYRRLILYGNFAMGAI